MNRNAVATEPITMHSAPSSGAPLAPPRRRRRTARPAIPARLLRSDRPNATLVLVEGSYVVADREEPLSGALPVVTRDELLERLGGR
ncbi:hypothetical protein [Lentzea roselyniae]